LNSTRSRSSVLFSSFVLLVCVSDGFASGFDAPPPPHSGPDNTGPTVSITSPPDGFIVTTPEVVFQGTAYDSSGVAGVRFGVDRPDGAGFGGQRATGTTSWTADVQGLGGGTNVVRIFAWDTQGNSTVVTNHIYFFQQTPLTVAVNGAGAVKPNLDGTVLESGKLFQMTEKPVKGSVFAGWTGDITSSQTTLNFMMRSNLVIQANFVPTPFVPAAGRYKGAIEPMVSGQMEAGGTFRARITRMGKFTARLKLGKKVYPLSGAFLADGSFTVFIHRKGLPLYPLKVQLLLDANAKIVTGLITDTSLSGSPTGALSGAIISK
jgi:hypothetical protein